MKYFLYIILFNTALAYSQTLDSITEKYFQDVVCALASDSMKGRATGSAQEILAANFIVHEFKKNKSCKVSLQKFEFLNNSIKYNSHNIIAFVNNHSKETILITAHYDHLGMGGELSNSKGQFVIHNGADDNASGVALMLSLSKKLTDSTQKYNFLFVAFSAHEIGLYGSEYFSNNLKKEYKKIKLAINFDMVGRLNFERKVYFDCSENLLPKMNTLKSDSVSVTRSTDDRINTLDTKWFLEKNIPSLTFSTGRHIDYHKETDDAEYINYKGILWIENMVLNWVKLNY